MSKAMQKVSIRFFNDREVRATNQLKLLAQDGKRYKTDVFDTCSWMYNS